MGLGRFFKKTALAATTVATTAGTRHRIATSSWELIAPEGWEVDLSTKPVQAEGPNGELLQVSSYGTPASSQGTEAQSIRRKVESNAIAAMQSAGSAAPLLITTPLSSTILPGGISFHEIVSTSVDGKALLAQFAMLGTRAAVLVTLDAPSSSAASVLAAKSALSAIKWVP